MAYAFGSQGATPSSGNPWMAQQNAPASTPQAKALNYATLGQSPAPVASAPIKSQVHTDAQGGSVKTTYDTGTSSAPTGKANQTVASSGSNPGYTYTNGVLSSVGGQAPTGPAQSGMLNPTPTNPTSTSTASTSPTATSTSTTPTPTPTPTPFSQATMGLLSGAQGLLSTGTAQETQAYDEAQAAQNALTQSRQNEAGTLANMQGNPIPIEFQQGRGNIVQGLYQTQQANLGSQVQGESALAGTGAGLAGTGASGLTSAGQLASPSNTMIQVPYSNQVLDASGNPVGGGAAGQLPQAAQDFITSLATQVKSGSMTRADAESRISQYSQPGLQALNAALGTGFNTNASNASAATTATGQQIQTAADSTNKALDTLSSSFAALPGWQTGTIPAGNSIGQWIGSQLGDAALQQYKTNLADARSQLIGVLNSSGGTPTGNESTAQQYLPDNMTPAQFSQNVGTAANPGIVRQLVAQKVSSFTGSGNQNAAPTGSSLYSF